VKDWAMGCLKAKTECQEGGKKRIMLRVIGLTSVLTFRRLREKTFSRSHLGPAKVEEYEVYGFNTS